MASFDEISSYGDWWAETYDALHPEHDPTAAVELLVGLVGDNGALELGVGTGRVALPLAARGVRVVGLDSSAAMIDKLRAKQGGADLEVVLGDMADIPVEGPFDVVFVAFNSLYCLLTQEQQTACFASAARVLAPGGSFVIECFIPNPGRFDEEQRVEVLEITEDFVAIELSSHQALAQRINTQILMFDKGQTKLSPLALRYSWPSELDLMANAANLRLADRYGDWDQQPLTSASTKHISVYSTKRE